MICWLASYPRAGNKFMRLLLESAGVETYSVYDNRNLDTDERPLPASLADLDALPEPYVVKTHEMPKPDTYRAVHLIRDGRDCAVSFAHLQMNASTAGTAKRRQAWGNMVRNHATSHGWSDMSNAWRGRGAFLVKFEDLIADPVKQANRVLNYLNVTGTVTPPAFDDLHAKRPNYFRKGTSGQWRTEMPRDVQEKFWAIHGPTMLSFGYSKE